MEISKFDKIFIAYIELGVFNLLHLQLCLHLAFALIIIIINEKHGNNLLSLLYSKLLSTVNDTLMLYLVMCESVKIVT